MGIRILGILALISILIGLYWGLVEAPPDARQGETQRIMYLHIPSILTAYLAFFIVFVGSCLYLWKGDRRDDVPDDRVHVHRWNMHPADLRM